MIDEQVIQMSTGKLAKKAGYQKQWGEVAYKKSDGVVYGDTGSYTDYPAPRQAQLQGWLRKVHNIDVLVLRPCGYVCFLYWGNNKSMSLGEKALATYEDVLEEGLVAALNLVLKK